MPPGSGRNGLRLVAEHRPRSCLPISWAKVASALTTFADEIARHERAQCPATNRRPFLPLPAGVPTTEDDWT